MRNQDSSVAKAKQAISSYRNAVGEPAKLAELRVFYSESAAGFSNDIVYQEEGYFDAQVQMFEHALKANCELSAGYRDAIIARLDSVRTISHNFGYGVGDDMDDLLAKYVRPKRHWQPIRSCLAMLRSLAENPRTLTEIGTRALG